MCGVMERMNSHFFAYLYRLKHIQRWSLMRNVTKENVAEHSYHVAILTHALCSIGNELFEKCLDANKAATLALFHDATEMFTGDIPTPVKHNNPAILQNFRQIEHSAADKLVSMAPAPLQHIYASLLLTERTDDELMRYVKAADRLDAYLKCVNELNAGNYEFATAKEQIKSQLLQLNMPEVDYFLKHLAPSFEKTLDEISLPIRNGHDSADDDQLP